MEHTIMPATANDLSLIYSLFEEAIRFQKDNKYIACGPHHRSVTRRLRFNSVH